MALNRRTGLPASPAKIVAWTTAAIAIAVAIAITIAVVLKSEAAGWLLVAGLYGPCIPLTALAFAIAAPLQPRQALRERSVLVARLARLGSLVWGIVVLVVSSLIGALVAYSVVGLDQMTSSDGARLIGRAFASWLLVAWVLTGFLLVVYLPVRLGIDLGLAGRPERKAALLRAFLAPPDAEEWAPRRAAWAEHLSHPLYVMWVVFGVMMAGAILPIVLTLVAGPMVENFWVDYDAYFTSTT